MSRADADILRDTNWSQRIHLTESMWDVARHYLLGRLSRAEYGEKLSALHEQYRVVSGGGDAFIPILWATSRGCCNADWLSQERSSCVLCHLGK